MNGNWFPWGQKPTIFKKAWKRIYSIFRSNRAHNVQWMFSPNILAGEDPKVQNISASYPGNAVVDLIGIDGYNFGDHYGQWHTWESYEEVFEKSIAELTSFNKPLLLSEVGCANDPRKIRLDQ